ncbi:MAG: hypothetical protein V4724_02530 [Pseudomonadota bacterium]
MSIKHIVLAGLCTVLGACASSQRAMDNSVSSTDNYGPTSASTVDAAMTPVNNDMAASAAPDGRANTAQAQMAWGVVQSVETLTRQDAAIGMAGSVGAIAAGGVPPTVGAPTDKVYRVTLRMDDGSTKMMTLETQPTYKSGDRVRYANGMAQKE